MQRSQRIAALFLVLAFLLGGAVGVSADRAINPRAPKNCGAVGIHGAWALMTKDWDISATQQHAIDSLLDQQHLKMVDLYAPVRPALDSARAKSDALSDSTLAQIRVILTPAQQAKLDAMRKDAKQRADFRRSCRDEGRDTTAK